MKLDILVLASHPDDLEISCSGTVLSHIAQGKKVGAVDFTQGELGTRGNADLRMTEANEAARILGLTVRENLNFRDGFFKNDEEHQLEVIRVIRKFRPEIVLANAINDRHIDHGKGAELARDACFLSGLSKISTKDEGMDQEAWRPKMVYHYIQNNFIVPDVVVDISAHWDKKIESIKAFRSQFFDPDSKEPETFISRPGFLDFLKSRARELGHSVGVQYGEGFTVNRYVGVKNLFDLL